MSGLEGFTAGSFMGVPIAVEHHGDGSVTLCKEIVDSIINDPGAAPELVMLLTRNASSIIESSK